MAAITPESSGRSGSNVGVRGENNGFLFSDLADTISDASDGKRLHGAFVIQFARGAEAWVRPAHHSGYLLGLAVNSSEGSLRPRRSREEEPVRYSTVERTQCATSRPREFWRECDSSIPRDALHHLPGLSTIIPDGSSGNFCAAWQITSPY